MRRDAESRIFPRLPARGQVCRYAALLRFPRFSVLVYTDFPGDALALPRKAVLGALEAAVIMNYQRRSIIADPVHRVLDFGPEQKTKEIIKAVVDHPAFQRLRRISQLGLASFVFPCATHTRFSHSLGAAYLARVAVDHLAEFDSSNDVRGASTAVICAALLHDVGHGPFSHAFEESVYPKNTSIKHERWGRALFQRIFRKRLADKGADVDLVNWILHSKESKTSGSAPANYHPYQTHLVSSQLDVDRMDYLVRDAHFAGVSMGQIDVHYLIKSLVIIHKSEQRLLGLSSKGVKPYEAFALARHLMNRSVYYHTKVRVLEFMVKRCLQSVVSELKNQPRLVQSELVPKFLKVLATESPRLKELSENADAELPDSWIEPYLELTEDSAWMLLRHVAQSSDWQNTPSAELAQRLLERNLFKCYRVHEGHSQLLEDSLKNARFSPTTDFAIVSSTSTAYKDSSVPVLVQRTNGTTESISKASFTIGTYNDRPEAEHVLVVTNERFREGIWKVAEQLNCLSVPPPQGT